ncbi:MAG: hypothetical protein ABIQ61_03930 [Ornithinibacter sp.]
MLTPCSQATFDILNVWTDAGGDLHSNPPTSTAGDLITFRAETGLHVGLTACSAENSNGGTCTPIDHTVGS